MGLIIIIYIIGVIIAYFLTRWERRINKFDDWDSFLFYTAMCLFSYLAIIALLISMLSHLNEMDIKKPKWL